MKIYQLLLVTILSFFSCTLCDFVEDPGSVPELDPDVYLKDIMEGDKSENYAKSLQDIMNSMAPSDMLTLELGPKEEQVFYMRVGHSPSKILMVFSVTSSGSSPIDFKVNSIKSLV